MRLIFIRHAEPNYELNTLTEKGFREAGLLAHRTSDWAVTQVYCSPLGRAKDTAAPTLKALEKEAIELEWLREFYDPIDPALHPFHASIAWDFSPEYLNEHPELFDPIRWKSAEIMQSGRIGERYDEVCRLFDELLASYGYRRNGLRYDSDPTHIPSDAYMRYDGHTLEYMKENRADYTDTTLVFFCHLGIMKVLMSHLINVSPVVLWHGFCTAPASVTILNAEERIPGQAYFRCQVCGDTAHLREAGEPVSFYGAFAAPFQA